MSDFPNISRLPLTIWTGGRYGPMNSLGLRAMEAGASGFAGVVWGTANLGIYVPMQIPFAYPVKKIFWYNHATLGGNMDAGVYNDDLSRICSCGSTAQAGTTQIQFASPTVEVVLQPGNYYFAIANSTTTAAVSSMTTGSANHHREIGAFQMASSLPLPAAAVPAAMSVARIPLIGVTYQSSPSF